MRNLLHKLRHLLKRHSVEAVTWRRGDGMIMVGRKCLECGEIDVIHIVSDEMLQPWVSGIVECEACDYRWAAVRPLGTVILECPECGEMSRCREIPHNP